MSADKSRSDGQKSDQPAVYEIKVSGILEERWSDWFCGFTVAPGAGGETSLTGPVADQAALHGLLNKIRDIGLPLLSVNKVENKKQPGKEADMDKPKEHAAQDNAASQWSRENNLEVAKMIQLTDVSKWYQMGDIRVTALDGISLTVEQGEFVVVLGPSGSGKTTLLNMIGALDVPSDGEIQINGTNLSNSKRGERFKFRRETVGFVFQTFNLFPSLTALENVQYVLDVVGKKNGAGKLAAKVLESVGLGDRIDHFPHQLSGGEQQRVAIARALAKDAPVILADEPTGELDFRTGVQILQLLRRQANAGKAVVIVTHNREIARVANRVIELHSGQIASDGPPPGGPVAIAELMW